VLQKLAKTKHVPFWVGALKDVMSAPEYIQRRKTCQTSAAPHNNDYIIHNDFDAVSH
jgi:hypothetical protein